MDTKKRRKSGIREALICKREEWLEIDKERKKSYERGEVKEKRKMLE